MANAIVAGVSYLLNAALLLQSSTPLPV